MNHSRFARAAATIIGSVLFVVPLAASAQTTSTSISDLQSQIQSLLTQIKTLQQQILQMRASSTPPTFPGMGTTTPPTMKPCPMFVRNLSIGSQGDDVKQLQQTLADNMGFSSANVTGFFGPATAKALMNFQQMFGVSSSSTGVFGPITRDFMGKHCGEIEGNGHGGGMTGSSTVPWMPAKSDGRGEGMGGGNGGDGKSGTSTFPWMNGSSTPPHMPPPPHMMGSSTPPYKMQDGDGNGGWHGSVPPWQSNQ